MCGDEDDLSEDLIPGDNDKQGPPSDVPATPNPNAPDNLTRIPNQGGDIPIVSEPQKPLTQ